jgi:hypothetical protein
MLKEAVVAWFEVLSGNLPGGTEKDHEEIQVGWGVRAESLTPYLLHTKWDLYPLDHEVICFKLIDIIITFRFLFYVACFCNSVA